MSDNIEILGRLNSEDPHPGSLIKPAPFTTESGETKDPIFHIAVAQVAPDESGLHAHPEAVSDASLKEGLAKLERWASEAAKHDADVVVFPEYFLSGADHDLWRRVREAQRRKLQNGSNGTTTTNTTNGNDVADQPENEDDEEEAQGEEKEWISVIIQLAQKYNIDIVAGTVVELGTQPHKDILSDHPVHEKVQESTSITHDLVPHRQPKKARIGASEEETENGLYNTSYYVSRLGKVLHRYTKQNLWHPERETLAHSQNTTHPEQHSSHKSFLIQTKRGTKLRASMAICWDLAWYSRFHQMIAPPYNHLLRSDLDVEGQAPGPDVIFAPTCWYASDGGPKALLWNGVGEAQMLDTFCQSRALELESILIMCNVAGPFLDAEKIETLRQDILKQEQSGQELDSPLIGLGRSCICSPFLNIVAQIPDQREALLFQTIDLNILRDARQVYRMRYDHAQR